MMTLGSDAKVGTAASPISNADGLKINENNLAGDKEIKVINNGSIYTEGSYQSIEIGDFADRAPTLNTDSDITVINNGVIHSESHGISVFRGGEGKLKVEHKTGEIVSSAKNNRDINVNHGTYIQ